MGGERIFISMKEEERITKDGERYLRLIAELNKVQRDELDMRKFVAKVKQLLRHVDVL